MMRTTLLATILAVTVIPTVQAQEGGGGGGGRGDVKRREIVVQRFRERSAEVVKDRLGLNDDQMAKLQAVNIKLEEKRRPIFQREKEVRMELRKAMENENANQDRIAALMDESLKLQQKKLDLVREEQKELSKFMTATQRAQYFSLQSALRERMERPKGPRPPR